MSENDNDDRKGSTDVNNSDPLEADELLKLLSNERRRLSVQILQQNEEITVRELSELVASLELEKDIEELSQNEIKRVYTALQQSHLPKLAKAGVIEYDKSSGVIKEGTKLNDISIQHEVETYGVVSLRRVLFASTFGTSIFAFLTGGIVGEIATYVLPLLILILILTLLYSSKSGGELDPPALPDVSPEIDIDRTSG